MPTEKIEPELPKAICKARVEFLDALLNFNLDEKFLAVVRIERELVRQIAAGLEKAKACKDCHCECHHED